jgi:hypothetical protein
MYADSYSTSCKHWHFVSHLCAKGIRQGNFSISLSPRFSVIAFRLQMSLAESEIEHSQPFISVYKQFCGSMSFAISTGKKWTWVV